MNKYTGCVNTSKRGDDMSVKIKWKRYAIIIIFMLLICFISYGLINALTNGYGNSSLITQSIASTKLENNKIKVAVDRFEEKYALCEKDDKSLIEIKNCLLPKGVKEGDVLSIDGKHISIDIEETKKRKNEIDELMKDIEE